MKKLKNKKTFLLLFYIFSLSSCLMGQDSLNLIIQGPYGGDFRTRPSYGILPDLKCENSVKVSNLKSKRIAIAVSFPQVLTITNDNFWKDKSIDYKYKLNIEDLLNTLIFSNQAQSIYNFKLFEKEDSKRLSLNIWTGNLKLSKTILDSLANKYESDYLIFIRGEKSRFFLSGMKNKGSLGLYGYGNSKIYMVYASQVVYIYNLKTGKLLKNGGFPQESADVIPIFLTQDFKDFTPEQLAIVDKFVEMRLRNNLIQSYKLLGIE